jgi:hypothetical protein
MESVNELAQWARSNRAEKLAFHEAIEAHERAHTSSSIQNPRHSRPKLPSAGRGGGKGRRLKTGSSGSNSMTPRNMSDLAVRPPTNKNVPSKVPKQVSNLICWDIVKYDVSSSTSASVVVENNFNWSLQNHPQYTNWTALFDQYCIPQASITVRSYLPPGSTANASVIYTALDFDNSANLGSVAAIEDFATCGVMMFGESAVVTRSVRPTSKVLGGISGGSSAQSDLVRSWHDCANSTIAHYGIRVMTGLSNAAYPFVTTVTLWFAFRNQI